MKKTKSLLCLLFAFIIMTAGSVSAYAADITQLTEYQSGMTAGYNPYSTGEQSRSIIGDDGGGNVLSTKVGTSVLFYFQNAGADSAIWAGSARTLTYTNN